MEIINIELNGVRIKLTKNSDHSAKWHIWRVDANPSDEVVATAMDVMALMLVIKAENEK